MSAFGRLSILVGVLALASFVALDVSDSEHNFVSAFLLGPVLAALSGRVRPVLLLGIAALLAAVASGLWNDDFVDLQHGVRAGVVASGSSAALLAVTARARAEHSAAQHRFAEAQLAAVLENLAEAVTVQDTNGQIVFANQAAAELLDAGTPEELVATPVTDLMGRFATFNEDGTPVRLDQLPGRHVLAGRKASPLLVRAVNRRTGAERWRLTKATAVHDDEGRVRFAVNIIEDVTEVKRAERAQRLLADASAILASSLDYEELLQQVARMAVPGFADWCGVTMPGEPPFLKQVAVAHADPARLEFAARYSERYPPRMDNPGGTAEVMRTGEPQLITGITDELLATFSRDEEQLALLKELSMRSAVLVPMRAGMETLGVITFVSAESERDFTEDDLGIAMELGRRAGVAVENARLFTERSEIADSLQQGLLPQALPDMGAWRAAAHYQAASEAAAVGGDFYDAFRIEGGWMIFVGDVAGRGHAAATLTALARYTLRTAGVLTGDAVAALATLNQALRERDRLSLCSACVAILREDEGGIASAEVLCAGHPPPFVIRGPEVWQVGSAGPLLGAVDTDVWPSERTQLEPGDMLLLYTDGVIDARGPEDRFGEARLGEALRGADRPDEAIERVQRAVDSFHTGPLNDDMAMVAVLRGEPSAVRSTLLPEGPDAARAARRLVEEELAGLLDGRRLEDARLLASELVTNAIRHGGGGPIHMSVGLRKEVARVEVRDTGHGFDAPNGPPAPDSPSGRGLMLVDMLSDGWGISAEDGTLVWFELSIPR